VARNFHPGMGQAVAERTILRKRKINKTSKKERWETWKEVAERVSEGNALLCKGAREQADEFATLNKHIGNAVLLMSGRHLQHGDVTQPQRNMEVFTNCSTAHSTFALAYLLLNGSGVGRCYDDDLMLVNWDHAPNIVSCLDENHPDFDYSAHMSVREAKHKYGGPSDKVIWHDVDDSREGWGGAIELAETLAFEKIHVDKILVLNWSKVRGKNQPIAGMQNRPSSGPVPMMNAFQKVAGLKGAGMAPWKQAMFADHYFAESVMMGGVRRSARMSAKYWKDPSIFEFIDVKMPVEFLGMSGDDILEYRRSGNKPEGFLWSSNNSILVDKEFWDLLRLKKRSRLYKSELAKHARKVFERATEAAYCHGTGEPGFVNVDTLVDNRDGLHMVTGNYIGSQRYTIQDSTKLYLERLLKIAKGKTYYMIVNPCGEICLAIWGAFCTIADLAPYHAETLEEVEDAARAAVRALIRVNTMDSIYSKEVKRTNRIGVGLTGIHEFAWKFFGYSFRDLIDESKSRDFWNFLSRLKWIIRSEAISYANKLGVPVPHTDTTIKPSGTISKLFGLTEGWHLPAMLWYLRWVQFRSDNPLIAEYEQAGYPIRVLKQYKGTTIVGFPTIPVIAEMGIPVNKLVTASEATPDEQYQWLRLGEKHWIRGFSEEESKGTIRDTGNQISYTLKYDPSRVTLKDFRESILRNQSTVKACSVMQQEETGSYEYLPEQAVTKGEYESIVSKLKRQLQEDVDRAHVDCSTGGCPIDFNKT
jgi:adenosylcobalamin-dependent ribonucleoside-triphosphate reductase